MMGRTRRERTGSEVLCGVNPVLEQLRRDPGRVLRVLLARGPSVGSAEVRDAAVRAGVEVVVADPRRLQELAGDVRHQGAVAEVRPYEYVAWDDLLAEKAGCLLVADQVTDPRNLGAMIRSAEAAGIGGVVLPRDRSAAITAVTAKAAAGATSYVPIARVTNLARALEDLKAAGYWIAGLDPRGPHELFSFSFPDFSAIVVGSEGAGLRPLTRSKCDYLVSIPMAGKVGSLNVSVAAALAFFERFRQRHGIDSSAGR